jgi:hypothetical protein
MTMTELGAIGEMAGQLQTAYRRLGSIHSGGGNSS